VKGEKERRDRKCGKLHFIGFNAMNSSARYRQVAGLILELDVIMHKYHILV